MRRPQAGMGIVSAIFLILVVAVLTIAVLRTVRTSADSFSVELLGQRAFLTAESGAQLAVRELYPQAGVSSCAVARVWDLSDFGLPGCQATVACRSESVGGELFYTVESRGQCSDGAAVSAERVIKVRTRS